MSKRISVLISIILYLASVILVYQDNEFIFRWWNFSIWCLSLFFLTDFFFLGRIKFKKINFGDQELWPFLLILILSLSRFFYLESYPYTGTGDATRDGGLNSIDIYLGVIRNIFGFTFSQGFLITTLLSLQYYFAESSFLSYRLPAALISFADILTVYFMVKRFYGQRQAFYAALAAVCCIFHLYYARTEILIILGSLFSSLMIYQNALLNQEFNSKRLIRAGVISGFACGFHASLWVMCLLSAFFAFCTVVRNTFSDKNNFIKYSLLLFFSVLIGYGPRMVYTYEFLTNYSGRTQSTEGSFIYNTALQYLDSLSVIFYQPLNTGHLYGFTFFPAYCGIFIICGLFYLFKRKRFIDILLLISFFLIIFTNGAITEKAGAEYRLMPILPALFVMFGCGVSILLSQINTEKNIGKAFLVLLSGLIISLQVNSLITFFTEEQASNPYNREDMVYDYMLTDTIYLIQKNTEWGKVKDVCITTSREVKDFFLRAHNVEYVNFLAPGVKYTHQYSDNPPPYYWYVAMKPCNQPSVNEQQIVHEYCNVLKKYNCPADGKSYKIVLIK